MRRLILLFALLLVSPALAQYWGHYENGRFGYAIDIPPDFVGNGESDNGDGQMFYNLAGEQGMTVWGANLVGSFEDEALAAKEALEKQGWTITERSVAADWSVVAAMRDHRLTAERTILLCDRQSYATFSVEYNIRDTGAMRSVLEGLAKSFVPVGC